MRHGLIGVDAQGEAHCLSEQGFEMGRRSFIHIQITRTGDAITRVQVGGQCYVMGEGQLFLDV